LVQKKQYNKGNNTNNKGAHQDMSKQTMTENDDDEVVSDEMLITVEETTKHLVDAGVERLLAQRQEGVVNPIVLAKCLGIRPQMVYNYIKAGRIPSVKHNSTQKIVIQWDVAVEFAQRYLNRKLRKQIELDAQLEEGE